MFMVVSPRQCKPALRCGEGTTPGEFAMLRGRSLILIGIVFLALALFSFPSLTFWPMAQSSADSAENSAAPIKASEWPQADRLIRSDPQWLGGDAAFSVDLGGGRVLWMFGDSFIAENPGATRRQSAFVRNSVAIQTGYDPSQAAIKFYSGRRTGTPSDFAQSQGKTWLWPMAGVRLGDRLLLFYMREASDPNKDSLGFKSVGWNAFIVSNPDAEPSEWSLQPLAGPGINGRVLVGMSVVRSGDLIYAYALNDENHDAYLLRWSVKAAGSGQLSSPLWWCGADRGWQTDPTRRQIVIHDAGSEFSVQRDPRGGYLQVSSAGFGASSIVVRRAPHLEGPWSEPEFLYRPPESDASGAFVYGGKSHPELTGADLIVTYTANGSDDRLRTDMTIYYPRFVRVTFGKNAKSEPLPAGR